MGTNDLTEELLSASDMVRKSTHPNKPIKLQAKIGLDSGQVIVLKKCFDAFSTEEGTINCDTIGSILAMMGMKVGATQFIPS